MKYTQSFQNYSLFDQYFYCYMISLYQLIHTYNCEWDFFTINEKKFLNGTNLNYEEFARNKYLEAYQDNKIGLAQDILHNGMYFPYFVYGNKKEQPNEHTIQLALGKHRLYSKLLYQYKFDLIEKKFLFIFVPNQLPKKQMPLLNYYFYILANKKTIISDAIFINSKTELMKYFDITGGILSNLLINSGIVANPILNDEKLFKQFIESPLDEKNILFQYYNQYKLNKIDNKEDL